MPDLTPSARLDTAEQVIELERASIQRRRTAASQFGREPEAVRPNRSRRRNAPKQGNPPQNAANSFLDDLIGVCFSGGGIRSAAFCLGVLQSLYRLRFLQHCDYLSGVSGGGYVVGLFASLVSNPHNQLTPDGGVIAANEADVGGHLLSPVGGGEPLLIRRLSSGGTSLLDANRLLANWLPGFFSIVIFSASLLVACCSFGAFLFRCLDYPAVSEFWSALKFRDDVTRAAVPTCVLFLVWCGNYAYRIVRSSWFGIRYKTPVSPTITGLLIGSLFVMFTSLMVVGQVSLVGVQDVLGVRIDEQITHQIQSLGAWVFSVVVVTGLIPYLRLDWLMQSGRPAAPPLEQSIYRVATGALLFGVPLLLFGVLAAENISGFQTKRPFPDGFSPGTFGKWSRFWPAALASKPTPGDCPLQRPTLEQLEMAAGTDRGKLARDAITWLDLGVTAGDCRVRETLREMSDQSVIRFADGEFDDSATPIRTLIAEIVREENYLDELELQTSLVETWLLALRYAATWNPRDNRFHEIWRLNSQLRHKKHFVTQVLNIHALSHTPNESNGCDQLKDRLLRYAILEFGDSSFAQWTLTTRTPPPPLNEEVMRANDRDGIGQGPADDAYSQLANAHRLNRYSFDRALSETRSLDAKSARSEAGSPPVFVYPSRTVFAYVVQRYDQWTRLRLVAVCGVIGLLFSLTLNLNATSLHRYYRDRLSGLWIVPHPTRGRNIALDGIDVTEKGFPYFILNGSLEWNEKQAPGDEPEATARYLMTSRYCGSDRIGYLQTSELALSLPDAVAISGAAVSVISVRPLALRALLWLGNLRLGQWLRNPYGLIVTSGRSAERSILNRPCPLKLALDLARYPEDERDYVFVSDGGIHDNLGIGCLLRRRCKVIVAIDAGADRNGHFISLMKVITSLRLRYGFTFKVLGGDENDVLSSLVPELTDSTKPPPAPKADAPKKRRWALIRVTFPKLPHETQPMIGYIVFVRPNVTGSEPEEVRRYNHRNADFPFDPTIDQFYELDRFEAYRMLGVHSANEVLDELGLLKPIANGSDIVSRVEDQIASS